MANRLRMWRACVIYDKSAVFVISLMIVSTIPAFWFLGSSGIEQIDGVPIDDGLIKSGSNDEHFKAVCDTTYDCRRRTWNGATVERDETVANTTLPLLPPPPAAAMTPQSTAVSDAAMSDVEDVTARNEVVLAGVVEQNAEAQGKLETKESVYAGVVGPERDDEWWDALEQIWRTHQQKSAYYNNVTVSRLRNRVGLRPMRHLIEYCVQQFSESASTDTSSTASTDTSSRLFEHASADSNHRTENPHAITVVRTLLSDIMELSKDKVCIVKLRHSLRNFRHRLLLPPAPARRRRPYDATSTTSMGPIETSNADRDLDRVVPTGSPKENKELWRERWTLDDVSDVEDFVEHKYNLPVLVAVRNAHVTSIGHVYSSEVGLFQFKELCLRNVLPDAVDPKNATWYAKVFVLSQGLGHAVFHGLTESLPRVMTYYQELLADPSIRIHIPVGKRSWRGAPRSILRLVLPLMGISETRLVTGDVAGGIVFFPEPIPCASTDSYHLRQTRSLMRAMLEKTYPSFFQRGKLMMSIPTLSATHPLTRVTSSPSSSSSLPSVGQSSAVLHSPIFLSGQPRWGSCFLAAKEQSSTAVRGRDELECDGVSGAGSMRVPGVFIKRSLLRRITNFEAMVETVQRSYPSYDFQIFSDTSPHSLEEIFYIFYHARVIIAPHGAGLSNILLSIEHHLPQKCDGDGRTRRRRRRRRRSTMDNDDVDDDERNEGHEEGRTGVDRNEGKKKRITSSVADFEFNRSSTTWQTLPGNHSCIMLDQASATTVIEFLPNRDIDITSHYRFLSRRLGLNYYGLIVTNTSVSIRNRMTVDLRAMLTVLRAALGDPHPAILTL